MLLAMTMVVFWNNPGALCLSAFLLGTNHPEQGAVMILLLSVFSGLTRSRKETLRFVLAGLGSLAAGILVVQWYFATHSFDIEFTRLDYLVFFGLFPYIRATLSDPFVLLFSLYNTLWLFVAAYLAYFWKTDRSAMGLAVYSVLALAVVLFTVDQTRVFALLTFPALLLLVLSPPFSTLEGVEKHFFEIMLAITCVVGIAVPRIVVQDGIVHASAYGSILLVLQAMRGSSGP